jgi:hypothetical protein
MTIPPLPLLAITTRLAHDATPVYEVLKDKNCPIIPPLVDVNAAYAAVFDVVFVIVNSDPAF